MLIGFDDGAGGYGSGLVNSVRLGSLWRWVEQLCAVVLSGSGWARVSCGPGLL